MNVVLANLTDKNFKISHRKENNYQGSYMVVDKNLNVKLDVRVYGTNAMNYCCMWMSGDGRMYSGSGSAGGCGYHRTSAAFENALLSMGIRMDQGIGGVGDTAMYDAMYAIASHMGWGDVNIIHAHP